MADEADLANDYEEDRVAKKINEILATPMPKGNPGDCDLCGDWSGRLVKKVCAPCRDKFHLP